jgi:hypothetical protein
MSDERRTKTCPDCAETVLGAARKCRFCGYRFVPESDGSLRSMLRRTNPAPMSVGELLDQWDIPDVAGGPEPSLFTGSIAGVSGFVVVTETDFYFVPAVRWSKARVSEQHRLDDLLRIHPRRHRMRRALFIEWRDTRTILEVDGAMLKALFELLSPRALIQSSDG